MVAANARNGATDCSCMPKDGYGLEANVRRRVTCRRKGATELSCMPEYGAENGATDCTPVPDEGRALSEMGYQTSDLSDARNGFRSISTFLFLSCTFFFFFNKYTWHATSVRRSHQWP